MKKRLSLVLLILIFTLALFPAYYPPNDEAFRQISTLTDIYSQLLFGATNPFYDFSHNLTWVRAYHSVAGPTSLHQNLPSSSETRAPPA
jgi:hypothetical protein